MKTFSLILDAGHGGHDVGASAHHDGKLYTESLMTFVVAQKVHALLTCTHHVTMTRRHDLFISLDTRYKITKLLKPDAFVSIHCNAGPDSATGTETLYRGDEDLPLAEHVQAKLVRHIGLKNRGVRQDVAYLNKKLRVLSNLEIPSCLVELGFITNKHDMDKLADTDLTAYAIASGVRAWWSEVQEEDGQ